MKHNFVLYNFNKFVFDDQNKQKNDERIKFILFC